MTIVHEFNQSQEVEARHAPTLDAWLRESYQIREATEAEQWDGIDRVVMAESGLVTLDYKCDERAHATNRLFIETVSNSVTRRPGWIHTSRADWLAYFVVPDHVWMFRFARVRQRLPDWLSAYRERPARNVGYATLGVCVPMAVARQAVEYIASLVYRDGAVFEPSDRWEER